jgi:hypothetical protein
MKNSSKYIFSAASNDQSKIELEHTHTHPHQVGSCLCPFAFANYNYKKVKSMSDEVAAHPAHRVGQAAEIPTLGVRGRWAQTVVGSGLPRQVAAMQLARERDVGVAAHRRRLFRSRWGLPLSARRSSPQSQAAHMFDRAEEWGRLRLDLESSLVAEDNRPGLEAEHRWGMPRREHLVLERNRDRCLVQLVPSAGSSGLRAGCRPCCASTGRGWVSGMNVGNPTSTTI